MFITLASTLSQHCQEQGYASRIPHYETWAGFERDRRPLCILERDFLPGLGLGDQRLEQAVVQLMARLVTAERANQAVTEQVQITDRIQDLVLNELVLVTQTVSLRTRKSSTTIALSMLPPSARPFSRSISMSRKSRRCAPGSLPTNDVEENRSPSGGSRSSPDDRSRCKLTLNPLNGSNVRSCRLRGPRPDV